MRLASVRHQGRVSLEPRGWGWGINVNGCGVVMRVSCCSLKCQSARGVGVGCFVVRGYALCSDSLLLLRAKGFHDYTYEAVRIIVPTGVCLRLQFLFGCIV